MRRKKLKRVLMKEMRKLRRIIEQGGVRDPGVPFRCPSCGQIERQLVPASLNDELSRLQSQWQQTLSEKMDALGDLSVEKQAKLQMYLDVFAQTANMISHLLKSMSESAAQMAHHLK
jgi:hypothetical protein